MNGREKARDRYRLKYLLGQGTTAQVYLAEDINNGEKFAAKISRDYDMLRQEDALLKKIGSRVFPKAYDYFEEEINGESRGCLILEYLEGGTLQKAIEERGFFALSEAVRIVQEILECLRVLHSYSEPIVFRDVKPENIMFDREGRIRLIDAASAIQGKYRVGTYGYAAPEQFWEGVKPGVACDLYATGKVLAYLMTGKNPGEPPYDILDYCSRDKRIPPSIFRVLERSLAMDEMGRYESAAAFSADLEAALEEYSKVVSLPSRSVTTTLKGTASAAGASSLAPQAVRAKTMTSARSREIILFIVCSPYKQYFPSRCSQLIMRCCCFVKPASCKAFHGGGPAQEFHLFPTKAKLLYH